MTLAADAVRRPRPIARAILGSTQPRIAPPAPAKHQGRQYAESAAAAGIQLMPWQNLAARYLMARGPDGWTFREVVIVCARQNGKTELLVPRILMDLRAGKRILHTAHRMRLPRKVFLRVARILGKEAEVVRYAQGQEEIFMPNGGSYVIVAAQRGARGESADTLIVDEVREFEDFDAMAATSPTLAASPDPQTIYLSNAGSEASVVLNDLRRRGENGGDGEFAYLEWSADPERSLDDRVGWAQANPALGHLPGMLRNLEDAYRKYVISEPATFQTEHLCQWVASMRNKLVSEADWAKCHTAILDDPAKPAMAFSLAPDGRRCSVILSWRLADGRISCVELPEFRGDPLDVDNLGPALRKLALQYRSRQIGFSSADKALARHFPNAKAVDGKEFASASATFANLVQSGRLAWDGARFLSEDLAWAARKPYEGGTWTTVAASDEHPIPTVHAAIRAVWRASSPPPPMPRIG
jgi:hypothetical protein